MCGIVGYLGPKSSDSVLLVGLKKLEYRGYDSAGIAVLDKNELVVQKSSGKIEALETRLNSAKLHGNVGIGHTRWATHGEPTTINAHPHINESSNIAVVHNGIIENFQELKKELIKEGTLFVSETDTEVVPHLINRFVKQKFSLQEAFLKTLQVLEGKFALAMISELEPNSIYFARQGAPLIIAQGIENEFFVASDVPALVPLGKKAYYLKNGEWGIIQNNSIRLFDWQGKKLNFNMHDVAINEEEFDKGDFPHYMLKEIFEQPQMCQRIIDARVGNDFEIHFNELGFSRDYLAKLGRIQIQACGTSLNAGMIGKQYIESFAKIYTDADFASELIYRNPVVEGDTLVTAISQSGETADTLASIYGAKAKFLKVLSLLNNSNSTMARESSAYISLMAGPEIGVASTKAYTAQLLNLLFFSLYLGHTKWTLPQEEIIAIIKEVKKIPSLMQRALANIKPIQDIANYLKTVSDAIFLGRTYNYPTALEGALKLKEISYIHASGYAAGEFKHGPIALVSENVPVIVIIPSGDIRSKMVSNLIEVKSRKGKIISIISEGDEEVKKLSDFFVEIPETAEYLSPLITAIPLQLIAYYTAVYRDCDVDKPRNLAKSVTVE